MSCPLVMGVLNVTPDSFSDGGRYLRADDAVEHGRALFAEGADLVDVGGESSRPGADPVEEEVELARVVPVIEALAPEGRISVDTVKPKVAAAAVAAGATLINDISGKLWPVAADLGVGWVGMHMRGTPKDMQVNPHYGDVVGEVVAYLADLGRRARTAGVGEIWLDPGIGFGKTGAHNLSLLAHLDVVVGEARLVGCGVLVGVSRKSFLGRFGAGGTGGGGTGAGVLGPDDRLEQSLAVETWAMAAGVGMVRVHDVAPAVQAAALVAGPVGGA